MTLLIEIPLSYQAERRYIISVIFSEFLGLEYNLLEADRHDIRITAGGKRELLVTDGLFTVPEDDWLKKPSLPARPLKIWDILQTDVYAAARTTRDKIPVIYGRNPDNPDFFIWSKKHIRLGLDVFGSAFFMLTRYEEMVQQERDSHGRFPSCAGLASKENFLDRPIVNEYVEILWSTLKELWPGLVRKKRKFRILPSHDVDEPFYFLFRSFWKIIRRMGEDVLIQKNPFLSAKTFYSWLKVKATFKNDPFDTFDWIMDISEEAQIKSVFNFSTGGETTFDYPYPIDHPAIQNLIRKIIGRGHEVGFHPSYLAGLNQKIWNKELAYLKLHVNGAEIVGGRNHFLRFQVPNSWRYWNEAGLNYESSLSYADEAGFRCGICYEYPVFDLEKREKLALRERPLILMEGSVIEDNYMGLSTSEAAFNYMNQLKQNCRIFNGDFVILWHNSSLVEKRKKEMYAALLGLG